ncbi:MAG: amino acid adenylation domain-containing protein, partial [Bacteroidota bacterium]
IVAIALERSAEMIIAILAVLKAGGAYLPIDTDYPSERLDFMLRDSQAGIIISRQSLIDKIPDACSVVLLLDDDAASIALCPSSDTAVSVRPSELAYVIYTSGSTGRPKGVAVEHGGLSNLAQAQISAFSVTDSSRVIQFASFSFDASVSEIMMALCSGAALYIPNAEERMPGSELMNFLSRCGITHATLPPSALAVMPRESIPSKESQGSQYIFPDLKQLIVAGESCPPEPAAYWSEGRKFFNAYGPTEATVCATIADCSNTDGISPLSIGRPIANTSVYILDKYNQPVPIGIPGELYIGGKGVARGYLNRAELSAEKFIKDPFSSDPDARLYKSGDLARYMPDGNIEFLGRIDNQVKIRGFRIELGEIEAALISHPAVREAVVIARDDGANDKRLVAYVVTSDSETDAAGLREFLKTSLPGYMLPASFVFMDTLPLTLNGKVDRNALPEGELHVSATNTASPRNAIEEIMAGLWSAILNNKNIGVHDNFFELGGHSLLATKLASRMRDVLGTDIPVRWIFESPTIAELALRAEHSGKSTERTVKIPDYRIMRDTDTITPDMLPLTSISHQEIENISAKVDGGARNIQDIYPLTPLQEGILFHHQIQQTSDAYISFSLLAFDSNELAQSFTEALQKVIDRHDILRTAFIWERLNEPVQVVWRKAMLPVEVTDFDSSEGPVDSQLLNYCRTKYSRIDITRPPLIRVIIAQNEEQTDLIFLSHHLISDHTTLEVMLEEIRVIQQGQTDKLPMPVPFRNFVAQTRNGITVGEHEIFFRAMLRDIEMPTAPFGLYNIQGDGTRTVSAHRRLTNEFSARVRTQARLYGATPAALCHLAWALVLSRCCAQADVVFGSVLFGRMQGGNGIERALGIFINTLPVRITCDDRPVASALTQTQQLLLSLMRHEHAPLSLAQSCSSVPSPAPLFSSLLNYRHTPESFDSRNVIPGMEVLHNQESTNFPFDMSIDDIGNILTLTAQTDAAVDPDRICSYMQIAMESLVTALENAPLTPLCQLEILTNEEKQLMLYKWNNAETDPFDNCVHSIFEQQAMMTPDAVAVVFEDKQLTYCELNSSANQLSHRLIALGVKPGTIVAIALERSAEMIISLMAVLKAGAAYLPIDTDYPSDRLDFMLRDSQAGIIITRQSLLDRLPDVCAVALLLDMDAASIALCPSSDTAVAVRPSELAYVIYTSGSTGRPKGVAVEHGAVSYHCSVIQKNYRLSEKDRVLQFASFSFDASVEQILSALFSGAALILTDNKMKSPEDIHKCLQQYCVTVMDIPPAFFSLWAVHFRTDPVVSLRLIILGGDVLTPEVLSLRSEWTVPQPEIINAYGPTEATVTAVTYNIPVSFCGTQVPIGKPLPMRKVYILDKYNQPVPIGIPGELHIGGKGIARGYLNRPELTAEKFIKDPFSTEEKARLYKTGDLARYMSDGNIEFLGRLDNQVKIRGFRIELGEIESALTSHPCIKDAVVIAKEDFNNGKRLIAYIVPSSEGEFSSRELTGGELRTFLKTTLPDYMLPAYYVSLNSMPVTPNGKVDRRALPDPQVISKSDSFMAPRDTTEQKLVLIWESLLSISPVGIEDNFFEVGGHSLLVVRLVSEIEKVFGKHLPVVRVFESPTVAGIAGILRKDGDIPEASCLVKIRTLGSHAPLVFLSASGGVVSYLYPLARHLDSNIPFYTFQDKGIIRDTEPFESIEELAEHYVSLLLEVQKEGPFYLGGHSFGGHVAFAMAQILLSRGQRIAMLAIADTCAPDILPLAFEPAADLRQIASQLSNSTLNISREEIDGLNLKEQITFIACKLEEARHLPEGHAAEYLRRMIKVSEANNQMLVKYRPASKVPIPITLIKATDKIPDQPQLPDEPGDDLGWSRYTSQHVSIYNVPGNHITMMNTPNVEKLAQLIIDAIDG